MGLPVWRSPSPTRSARDTIKIESATTTARSPIRRRRSPQTSPRGNTRPLLNGRRGNATSPETNRRSTQSRSATGPASRFTALRANRFDERTSPNASAGASAGASVGASASSIGRVAMENEELPTAVHHLQRMMELTREHDRLSRARENLSRDADNDEGVSLHLDRVAFHHQGRALENSRSSRHAAPISRPRPVASNIPSQDTTYSPHSPNSYEDIGYRVAGARNAAGARSPPTGSRVDFDEVDRMPPLEPGSPETRPSNRYETPTSRTWDDPHLRPETERSAFSSGAVRSTGLASTVPETMVALDFAQLRRMNSRSAYPTAGESQIAHLPLSNLRESWSPAASVDGLGDRARSPSTTYQWEMMLSTITPDATLPSADSSFTSAAASASFSAPQSASAGSTSQSASTSHTHLTVPSRSDSHVEGWICDTDDEYSDHEQGSRLEVHRLARPDSPETSESRERDAAARSLEMATAMSDALRVRARETRTDPDLEQMRGILDRLASRDDIPDELWINAGLNPTLARHLDLFTMGDREVREAPAGRREREDRERL